MTNDDALLLTGAHISGSTDRHDVLIIDGVISDVAPAGRFPTDSQRSPQRVDLSGHVLMPAAAEPHAHLDKAFLADRAANLTGDLGGAIEALISVYPTLSADDVADRARRAVDIAVARGFTAIRTHADVDPLVGVTGVGELVKLGRSRSDVDLTVVALVSAPVTGDEGAQRRRLLDEAIEAGAHAVGGAPALDVDPHGAVRILAERAADAGLPIDLHLDETLDAGSRTLETFMGEVERLGLGGRATASHCVSLGRRDLAEVVDVARRLADVGIAVVTLPQTNLGLQAREHPTLTPRGLPPLRPLLDAGVAVAGGSDNWRDMFNPLGRIDPLETAALLVAAGHLLPDEAVHAVTGAARDAIGAPVIDRVEVGAPAELLAVRAGSVVEAIASGTEARTVIHRGRVVARTDVTTHRPTL
ncbi:cytosine deaminase [Gordonia spumicola]|uniref:Cytosine deaminase n=1 Tax=Gordonia spumicola TaxID=589161 RepID=A0A7I9V3T3_9ACTN|nr:amidohydrolase family protein [Gordonia spumicola]GED99823.1 cytosine deaminase [Gordonia spumicola]